MNQKKPIYRNYIDLFYCYLTILITSILIFMSNSAGIAWAATVYIDPDYNGTESGTFAEPYNSWNDVTFSASDDYCQKCGTSWAGSITITTSGTSGNNIIISAYYDSGGSPVHEWDNPSYGEICGNSANKPIITDSDNVGSTVQIDTGVQYIELNSLQIKEGEQAIGLKGSNNKIEYCRIGWGKSGIRAGLVSNADYNYIGYNYVYTDYGSSAGLDGIQLGAYADHNIVEYNVVDGFSHSGIATSHSGTSSYNEVRYNSIYSWDDVLDTFLEVCGSYNKFHHNYGYDCGIIQLYSGDHNEVYYNIIDGITSNPYIGASHGGIHIQNISTRDVVDNKIYNNIIYDRRDGFPDPVGVMIFGENDVTHGVIERNEIVNNIILNLDSTYPPFRVVDLGGRVDSSSGTEGNIWKNNLAYDYTGTYYAAIEGSSYSTAAAFNARGSNYDSNRYDDPGLKNPAGGEFWPASDNNTVVGNGKDVGALFKNILDPDLTDFNTQPHIVGTVSQPEKWYIGAYALPWVGEAIKEPTGVIIKKKE